MKYFHRLIRKKTTLLFTVVALALGVQACGSMPDRNNDRGSRVNAIVAEQTRALPPITAMATSRQANVGGRAVDLGVSRQLNRQLQSSQHRYRLSDPGGQPRGVRSTSNGQVLWRMHLEVITLMHRLDQMDHDVAVGHTALLRNHVTLTRRTVQGIMMHVNDLRQSPRHQLALRRATGTLMMRVNRLEKTLYVSKQFNHRMVRKALIGVKQAVVQLRKTVADSRR